ncbi:MAG: D-2-hydroxyacid dehydrogenase [Chloroflexi bacterium]|nr:D-2-hydroxyacid dehydrogenase [Chloroflexota bacterium]
MTAAPATKLTVLVGIRLPEALRQRIAAVDPRLDVIDASEGWRADFARRRPLNPQEERALELFNEQLERADIYFNLGPPDHLLARAPRLKWVHLAATGIDQLLGTPLLDSPLLITYSRGVNAPQVAEAAMGLIFMLASGARRLVEQQQRHEWRTFTRVVLHGKTLAVVGMGHIGGRVARMARAASMRVIGMRRSATERTAGDEVADVIFPPSQLREMLAQADVVLIAAPLTPETQGMIGREELAALKPTAFLVNIARGQLVDEQALIDALTAGRLAGAGLDVFTTEPLPADSPLWDLPNVIISPHIAGRTDVSEEQSVDFFIGNLRRFLEGRELLNRVDRSRYY